MLATVRRTRGAMSDSGYCLILFDAMAAVRLEESVEIPVSAPLPVFLTASLSLPC